MRSLVVVAASTAVLSAALATAAAQGAPSEGHSISGEHLVDGPWSTSITYLHFAASRAVTELESDTTRGWLHIDDGDPRSVVVYSSREFSFSAPEASGKSLRAGFYGGAALTGSTDPTRPQMSIGDTGRDCGDESPAVGTFDVRELHRTNGQIDRLWIQYEQHCKDSVGTGVFGEVRFGYPERPVASSPTLVTWPDQTFVGSRSAPVPLAINQAAATPAQVDSIEIVGIGHEHFELVTDNCTGADSPTSTCMVEVAFVPESPGPHRTLLRASAAGNEVVVPLEATAIPGQSVLELEFDASHPFGSSYPTAPARVTLRSDTDHFYAVQGESTPFFLFIQSFHPDFDHYAVAGAIPAGGVGMTHEFGTAGDPASLEFFGSEGYCPDDRGTLRVDALDVGPEEQLRRVRASFVHRCEDTPGADGRVVGELKYRWREDVQPPAAPADLELARTSAGRVTGSWKSPADADLAGTVARWYPGQVRAPQRPIGGHHVPITAAGQMQLPPRSRDLPVTVAVFGYDETGNVSEPAVARLP